VETPDNYSELNIQGLNYVSVLTTKTAIAVVAAELAPG
jgi:hypothetical protein